MPVKEKPLQIICIFRDYHLARTVHLLWFVKLEKKEMFLYVVAHNQDHRGLNLIVVFTEYS